MLALKDWLPDFKGALKGFYEENVKETLEAKTAYYENLLKEKPPITTSFADVDTTGMLDASFGSDSIYRPLTDLKRTEDGGFILEPGFYQLQVESYCLHAGTHGPSSGYGYMYAPVLGPKADIVTTISKNSIFHPEIAQHDIQLVLWAIIARSKFGDLQPNIKLVATKLLSHQQLLELQGGAIGLIPDALLQKGISSLPSSLPFHLQHFRFYHYHFTYVHHFYFHFINHLHSYHFFFYFLFVVRSV